MRDLVIARRALLGLAAGIAVAGGPGRPFAARPSGKAKPPPRPARKPMRVVALDPGHGGVDPGAISPGGIYEKDITLATARELARQLAATGRFRPLLTRRADLFVPLRQRVARARMEHAEMLLSIHADALPDSAMRGLSVYTLSDQASDRETAALAVRENRDNFVAGINLSRQPRDIAPVLLDLARRQTNNRSLALAHAVVAELGRAVLLLEKPHPSFSDSYVDTRGWRPRDFIQHWELSKQLMEHGLQRLQERSSGHERGSARHRLME